MSVINKAKEKSNYKARIKRSLRRFYAQRWLQLFAILGFVYILIFNYLPMLGIQIAFKSYKPSMGFKGMFTAPLARNYGFYHFISFFKDPNFSIVMRNTVGLSLMKLFFSFPVPILFALALNEMRHIKIKRIVQTVSYLPHFISWVIVYGILFSFLNTSNGVINSLLQSLGKEKMEFLTGKEYYYTIAVISDIWKEMGWWSIIFLAAISGIDQTQYEAAKVDGASRFRCIWSITLPNIKSTIMIVLILAIGSLIRGGMGGSNFDQSYLLGNSLNYERSVTLPYYVYEMGLAQQRFSYATAIGLFQSVISLLLVLISNYVSDKLTGSSLF
ncbi:MAG: ABC transporter permease [Christensenellales bacterium]|jgi:putative aldouronate transport system permease protein